MHWALDHERDHTLVAHLARFAGTLRSRGIPVGIGDEVDGVRALVTIDLLDRTEVRLALRSAMRIRREDWGAFDQAFDREWRGSGTGPSKLGPCVRTEFAPPSTRDHVPVGAGLAPPPTRAHVHAVGAELAPPLAVAPSRARDDQAGLESERNQPGYSPDAVLRRKPFEECSEDEIRGLVRMLDRLAPRLATRRSRRLVPAWSRGRVDLRRSPRRALATGGELVWLARRTRAIDVTRLVILCDTSGSMDIHARFLLAFALALKRRLPRTEVFAFNTTLTRLTPWFARGDTARTLAAFSEAVPDWSGGTRIGESLSAFADRWLRSLVDRSTVVLIFSDGLDRGDTTLVADAMRAIRSRARRVAWLNPLGGDPRYEPTARAMQMAMPYVDRLAPAHNLESLERALSELTV